MTRIILHVGDNIAHTTLGEGVVTIIDEEFVTIKFANDELTFRLPDAFEKGFLSSSAASIEEISNDGLEEDELEEEAKNDTDRVTNTHPVFGISSQEQKEEDAPSKIKLSRVAIWWRMFWLFFFTTPLMMLCIWLWIDRDDSLFLLFAGIIFVVSVVILYILTEKWDKAPVDPNLKRANDSESRIDPASELMIGMMGSEIINRGIKKEREAAEKRRYDSLYWQESIRDKNPRHDFDYDHLDD